MGGKHIYVFSGLGADERVFQRLEWGACEVTFVKWVLPLNQEKIEDYAVRLVSQILCEQPILLGVSFGGIMAIEVAKIIQPSKLILISSIRTCSDIPYFYRLAGQINLHYLIPFQLFKRTNILMNWLFGIREKADVEILNAVLIDTDPLFLKWAISKIVSWKNKTIIANTYQIHGTKDRILSIVLHPALKTVENGGHLMVLNKSDVIDCLIDCIINNNV